MLDLNEIFVVFLKILRRLIGEDIDLIWMPGAGLWPGKVDFSQMYENLANLCVNARDSIFGLGKIIIETANGTCDGEFCSINSNCVSGEYFKISVSDTGCGMDASPHFRTFLYRQRNRFWNRLRTDNSVWCSYFNKTAFSLMSTANRDRD